jgi:hypothetical protein
MNGLLIQLQDLINRYKLYENAIIFNGMDSPYFDLEKAKLIFKDELGKRIRSKIASINEQIEIAEEDHDDTAGAAAVGRSPPGTEVATRFARFGR